MHLYLDAMLQAYRLRHKVFVEEHGWKELERPDQLDIDRFDTIDAIHVLIEERGFIIGYARLLPTMKPHLLSEIFPFLAEKPIPRAADIYECTRMCVDPGRRNDAAIGNVGSRLLLGTLACALSCGITRLTTETDPIWITRFLDLGFDVDHLGPSTVIDGVPCVAMIIEITGESVLRCMKALRLTSPTFERQGLR